MALCTDQDSTLSRCLVNTLLLLGSAGLQALQKFINAELALVDIELAELFTKLVQYDLLGQLAKKYGDFAEAELNSLVSVLNGLPLGLLDKSCLEWASLNDGINGFLQNEIVPPIQTIIYEVERVASFQSELVELQEGYQALKQLLNDTLDLLDTLILEAKCRELAGQQNIVAA